MARYLSGGTPRAADLPLPLNQHYLSGLLHTKYHQFPQCLQTAPSMVEVVQIPNRAVDLRQQAVI